jgi:hypothetical protein
MWREILRNITKSTQDSPHSGHVLTRHLRNTNQGWGGCYLNQLVPQLSPDIRFRAMCTGVMSVTMEVNLSVWQCVQGVSKTALQWYSKCYCVASVTKTFALKAYKLSIIAQGVEPWIVCMPLSKFRNTRHTVTFGIPLYSFFWNALHYHITIPNKTWCRLLHYNSSKYCIYPMNKSI